MRSPFTILLVLVPLVILPLRADEVPTQASPDDREREEYYELYRLLADTLDQVERNYVKPIDRRELFEAAIEGVIKRKLDNYSSYITPAEIDGFRQGVDSEFGGLGIRIENPKGRLIVVSPLVGTPAYRAGILAGDEIVEIEGESTRGMRIGEVVKKLKGPPGTSVTITVVHPNQTEPETVSITREVIRIKTVVGDRRDENDRWDFMYDNDHGIGYIRLTAFSRDTPRELRHTLEMLKLRGVRGLVLDLRFNPGGLLTSVIDICDMFITEGTIVSTEGRNVAKQVWEAHVQDTFDEFPIAVLVNEFSASASEILAACLQDHERAVIIGERTWGKGSVQNVIELEGGRSALKLTTASYQRPSGKNIHKFPGDSDNDEWGVRPNPGYEVALGDGELEKLNEYRRQQDIIRPKSTERTEPDDKEDQETSDPPPATDEEPVEERFVDSQLRRALDYVVSELDSEEMTNDEIPEKE